MMDDGGGCGWEVEAEEERVVNSHHESRDAACDREVLDVKEHYDPSGQSCR